MSAFLFLWAIVTVGLLLVDATGELVVEYLNERANRPPNTVRHPAFRRRVSP